MKSNTNKALRRKKALATPKRIKLGGVVRKSDVPATQGTLYHIRNELKYDIKSLRLELGAEIKSLKSELKAEIHRLCALVEEQNARNAVVLGGVR